MYGLINIFFLSNEMSNKSPGNPKAGALGTHLFHHNPQDGHSLFSKGKNRTPASWSSTQHLPLPCCRGEVWASVRVRAGRLPCTFFCTSHQMQKACMQSCLLAPSCNISPRVKKALRTVFGAWWQGMVPQGTGRHGEPGWLPPSHGSRQLRSTGIPSHAGRWEKLLLLYLTPWKSQANE